jgi:phage-related protein
MDVSYDAVIMHDFDQMFDSFRVFMVSQKGYHRLEDTVHPDEYRMAEFTGPVKPNVAPFNKAGKFVIKFRCKPQRYLKSGEKVTPETTFTSAGQIYNPTPFESKPVLRVYGTGQFGIGNQSIRITSANQYTDFDCELKDAFKGTTNCNGNIQLLSGDFPVIKPGVVGISLGSGITKIEITPRWFLL